MIEIPPTSPDSTAYLGYEWNPAAGQWDQVADSRSKDVALNQLRKARETYKLYAGEEAPTGHHRLVTLTIETV
jgi:hypothetical protein